MLVSGVVLGVAAGCVFGGDWRRLARLRLRGVLLLIPAALIRGLGLFIALPLGFYLTALILVAIVAALNYRLRGATIVAAGILLNLLVISMNGGMPISAEAASVAGLEVSNDGLHIPLTDSTRLPVLADVLPLGIFKNVYSVGDVLLAIGGFWVPFALLRGNESS